MDYILVDIWKLFKMIRNFKDLEGKMVTIKGRLSNLPWQHLIDPCIPYELIYYFDIENEDQIVIYTKNHVNCTNLVELTGKIIKVIGQSKRPGEKKEIYEYQMRVDKWKCIDSV